MIKLISEVKVGKCPLDISSKDRYMVLGSCFADNIGQRMSDGGLDVMVNPFGTLYNPVSIASAIKRLQLAIPFEESEVVEMGAGAGKFCSFSHHTSFARKSVGDFLENANLSLKQAADFFKSATVVIITLGTSWCFRHIERDITVSNCLKRPAGEFERYFLSQDESFALLDEVVKSCPDKKFIFTLSPIRHLADGAHGNAVSKASLLLSEERVCNAYPSQCCYFPAYEILNDELRDYRFYAEDLVHPSNLAEEYVFRKYMEYAFSPREIAAIDASIKESRRSRHIPILNSDNPS